MAGMIFVGLLVALGVLVASGRAADSRDREYGVGPLFAPRPRPARRTSRAAATRCDGHAGGTAAS